MVPISDEKTMRDQKFRSANDEPPKDTGIRSLPSRYIGYPSQIQNWTAEHFQPWEFASKGNGRVNIDARLVERLEAVRKELNMPIRITSGYRDPAHNARVGGAKNSQHMHGKAVDIDLSDYDKSTRYRLLTLLVKHGFTSFGSYTNSPSMLHADIREHAAKWHHGAGTHPRWFSSALNDAGWKYGATAEEMMATSSAQPVELRKGTDIRRTVTVSASKSLNGHGKLEGQYEMFDPNGWGVDASIAFETETDNISAGLTAKYVQDGIETDFSAAYDGDDTTLDFTWKHDF